MAALYPHMETQLKLLYTAITRSCRTLTFAETSESKAGAAFFRWLQDKDLAEPLTETDEINDWAAGAGEYNFEEWCRAQGLTLAATAVSGESLGKRVSLLENCVLCFSMAGSLPIHAGFDWAVTKFRADRFRCFKMEAEAEGGDTCHYWEETHKCM
jgi:hypothetical protein